MPLEWFFAPFRNRPLQGDGKRKGKAEEEKAGAEAFGPMRVELITRMPMLVLATVNREKGGGMSVHADSAESRFSYPDGRIAGSFDEPAIEREHGFAAGGSAKMQGIGEVHALLREIERLAEQRGVLH